MDDFEDFYFTIRQQAHKAIIVIGTLSGLLQAILLDFKQQTVPNYRMPPVGSPGFEKARWFVTGIDGLVSASLAVSLAVVIAALLTVLSNEKDIILNFLYTTIPLTGFFVLYRTVLAILLILEHVQLGNPESISPSLLNEAIYWFYIGIYLFTVLFLRRVEKRYLRNQYGKR
jgi:hypothetical protein